MLPQHLSEVKEKDVQEEGEAYMDAFLSGCYSSWIRLSADRATG